MNQMEENNLRSNGIRRNGQNSNSEPSERTRSLDGGWGWIVMLSAFLVRMIIEGVSYSSGLFYVELKQHFKGSNSRTSWIFSVLNGTYHAIGPIVSVMVGIFGWRCVTIFGASLATISFLVCTWSPNEVTMIVTYGLMGGIGLGFMYVPAVVSVGHYFTTKRSLAIGVSACGSGVGGLVFAPLVEFLIRVYGWRGALWIIAGIALHGIPIGALLRPLRDVMQTQEPGGGSVGIDKEKLDTHDKKRWCCNVQTGFHFELFRSPSFLLYGASCFLSVLGLYIPLTYLPDYAEGTGHTSQVAAWLIATIGIFNTISRALVGWLASKPWTDVIVINCLVLVTGGSATIFVPYYHNLPIMFVYSAVFGITLGIFVVMNAIIVTELLGIEKLTSSFGLVNAAYGIAAMIGVPIAGALVDLIGNYAAAFYFAGTVISLSGIICFPLRRINTWEHRTKSGSDHSMIPDEDVSVHTDAPWTINVATPVNVTVTRN